MIKIKMKTNIEKLDLWEAVTHDQITAYLKLGCDATKYFDGGVCKGCPIVCNDVDETERGEKLLYIENDDGLWAIYESEFARIEYIDYATGEQVVMVAEDSGEENKDSKKRKRK